MCEYGKNKEGDEDMSIVKNDVTNRLAKLKERAIARKNNPNLTHFTSEESIKKMKENAELMYQSQIDTIKNSE